MRNVPMASVVLGSNLNGAPDKDARYDSFYLPDPFFLKPGETRTGVVVHLPPPLPFGTLFVNVLWPNGTPALRGARAFAEWNDSRAAFEHAASSSNRVALPLALGRSYEVSVDWFSEDRPVKYVDAKSKTTVQFDHDGQSVTLRLDGNRP